ncbi:hypothetical protein [Neobacillus sp. SAB-20_R2A]|uniref:hypothetical protein n=1 Tax=Neobacillus sp. SAB-20_R2A TaxID=3120519 RepID=UPI003C6E0531
MKKKSKISLLTLAVMLIGGLFFGFHSTLADNGQTIMVHIDGESVNIKNFTIYYKLDNSSVEHTAVLVRDNDDQPFFGNLSFEGKVPSTIYAKGFIEEKEYNFTLSDNGKGNPNGNGILVYWAKVGNVVVQPPDEEKPPVEDPGDGDSDNPPAKEPGSGNTDNPPPSGDNSGGQTQPGDTQENQPGNTSDNTQSGTTTPTTTTPKTTQPPTTTQVTQPAVQTLSTVSGGALPKTAGPWMNWLLLSGVLALGSSATLFMKFRKL